MRLSPNSILIVSILTILAWLAGTLLLACGRDMSCGTASAPTTPSPAPVAISETADCPVYLTKTIHPTAKNDRNEVVRLQVFLNTYLRTQLPVDGSYDREDIIALMQFQAKHGDEVLAPYRLRNATGIVGPSTRNTINKIHCSLLAGTTVPTPATGNMPATPVDFPLGLVVALLAAALSGSLLTLLVLSNNRPREHTAPIVSSPAIPAFVPEQPHAQEIVAPVVVQTPEPAPQMIYPDDLVIVEGIGPKIAELLKRNGITTLQILADTSPKTLGLILKSAGPRFEMHNPLFWPEQAKLLATGRYDEFERLKQALRSGRLK